MVRYNAVINREDDHVKLILKVGETHYEIMLSEDDPNNIKRIFNKLIIEIKSGKFEFILNDEEDDLYKNVCNEYIMQLNSEISNVYGQLKSYKLLDSDE